MVRKKKSKQSAFKADRNQKSLGISNFRNKWGFPKMVGFPNNPWVFLLKMIILGCEMGVPPFKEAPKYRMHLPTFFFSTTTLGIPNHIRCFFPEKKPGAIHAGAQRGQLRGCTMWRVLGMDSRCGGIPDDSDRFPAFKKTRLSPSDLNKRSPENSKRELR